MGDVLNADVDLLRNDPGADALVDDDADGVLRHVVHSTSFTVVKFVWHTLVEGAIALDVNDVTAFVDFKEGGQLLRTMLTEFAAEQVSSTSTNTVWVDHCGCGKKLKPKISFNLSVKGSKMGEKQQNITEFKKRKKSQAEEEREKDNFFVQHNVCSDCPFVEDVTGAKTKKCRIYFLQFWVRKIAFQI